MKSILLAFISGLLLILSTVISLAYALGDSPLTIVTEITQEADNNPLLKLKELGNAGSGCSRSGYLRFSDIDNSDSDKENYTIVLTALAANKPLIIRTKDCSADYPYIDHVLIHF